MQLLSSAGVGGIRRDGREGGKGGGKEGGMEWGGGVGHFI